MSYMTSPPWFNQRKAIYISNQFSHQWDIKTAEQRHGKCAYLYSISSVATAVYYFPSLPPPLYGGHFEKDDLNSKIRKKHRTKNNPGPKLTKDFL